MTWSSFKSTSLSAAGFVASSDWGSPCSWISWLLVLAPLALEAKLMSSRASVAKRVQNAVVRAWLPGLQKNKGDASDLNLSRKRRAVRNMFENPLIKLIVRIVRFVPKGSWLCVFPSPTKENQRTPSVKTRLNKPSDPDVFFFTTTHTARRGKSKSAKLIQFQYGFITHNRSPKNASRMQRRKPVVQTLSQRSNNVKQYMA